MTGEAVNSGGESQGVAAPAGLAHGRTFSERLPVQFLLWTVICAVSAAPSFILALMEFQRPEQILAMVAGIAVFIAAYTAAGSSAVAARLRRRPLLRRTLYIGYGTRLVLSLASFVPAVMIVDFFCGFVSVTLTGVSSGSDSPAHIFFTTIVQGVMLNILLGVFMAIVYGAQLLLFGRAADRARDGLCRVCGYDLRASAGTCPECGTAIEWSVKTLEPS